MNDAMEKYWRRNRFSDVLNRPACLAGVKQPKHWRECLVLSVKCLVLSEFKI